MAMAGPLAKLTVPAEDPAWLAWSLKGNPMLQSQLRALRREIGQALGPATAAGNAQIVVVTSALPGEGKTFVSLALARALAADKGRRVVLIDGDLPMRQMTRMFGLLDKPGLSESISTGSEISGNLHLTEIDGLTFLPAGLYTPEAADDMSGSRFDSLLSILRAAGPEFCFVIDSAPMLAAGETVYVASRSDLTVMVVRADQTPRGAVAEALRKLGPEAKVGLLLNGQQTTRIDHYYGYSETYGQHQT